ncbi:15-hydroxyprostaglandin dehydrogenase [NAD(+)]-like [Euwallacea similis]|uniref:15-hydroxyprostaglandin dehydrogenase [NAD(+)]-like n=1 Tax=Euwallacea similis TaxID=1736056 RepID=UPI00344B6CDD
MTYFSIEGKVAIVTGGASGLGYNFVKQLLEKGAKGVTLMDISEENGNKVMQELQEKYDKTKVLFIRGDVRNCEEFEKVFKLTIEAFNHLDILINNAGIFNDLEYETEVGINLTGTLHGMILGLEKYLPKYKLGNEGVIVNISSIAGVNPFAGFPIYSATKFAIHGLTLSWGLPQHYDKTKIKVVAVCPGFTTTPLLQNAAAALLSPAYAEHAKREVAACGLMQTPEDVALHMMTVIEKAPSGTVWVVEKGEPPYKYEMPDRFKISKTTL